LLARLIEPAPVAYVGHALRQFGRSLRCTRHLLGVVGALARCDRIEISDARIACQRHRLGRRSQFCLFEALAFNIASQRHRQQSGQVEHDAAINLDFAAAFDAAI
jgi:hypothetical protein